jgi:hypothetical protein
MINPLHIINQLFEIHYKMKEARHIEAYERNINRLYHMFEEAGYLIQDPTGESYTESRTDCEASITGRIGNKMVITRTLKPIIYLKQEGAAQLQQKAVVIVENK